MADGTVVAFLNTMAENTKMGKQDPTPNPVEGNHFYIQHGDELMLYAHFQTGSLNPKLMQVGAAVKAGDFLGLAGNSGNSTNPHLHIHCLQATKPWGGPPRPLPFHDIHVIDQTAVSMPNRTGPWVKVSKQGLPGTQAAIWPYRRAPVSQATDALTPHAVGIAASGTYANRYLQGLTRQAFLDETQKLFDEQGLRLTQLKRYLDHGQRRWAGICRSGDWANRFVADLTWSDFLKETQRLFDERGLRLVDVLTYKDALGIRCWAGIARGGSWANRLFASNNLADFADDGQRYFDEKGLRLVGVEIYTP
ncbi:peptidoglycan DD-metalloendopeptidase family protein [Myxococcus sp. RHSTA-1-4]|uniref:peptidoglycan DD-metalloendopeptidase family protein n=1 Tax=Myxococcus sp. RHSTA-1-4 TaxID=2874601 RepID=UPI001CECBA03|nr:peptidoglycan DD-metalloendopeptidase family protein [Myxococcus sp. RHSTA-1-4]